MCRACVIREQKCEYGRARQQQQQGHGVAHQAYTRSTVPKRLAVARSNIASVSPANTFLAGACPSAHIATLHHPLTRQESSSTNFDIDHSHLALFDHYLRHTCHASGLSTGYAYARRIGLPTLAAKSKGVLCSILALGSACLCVDFLLGPDPLVVMDHIVRLVNAGDYYHGKALATIQSQLDARNPSGLDIAHAHASTLAGYAPARRRIFRLLRGLQPRPALVEHELGADAPNNLDWAFLLRGIRTIAKARDSSSFQTEGDNASADVSNADSPDAVLSAYVAQAVELEREQIRGLSPCPKPSSMQGCGLKSVMSSSFPKALYSLYQQINSLELKVRHKHSSNIPLSSLGIETNPALSSTLLACVSAVTTLEDTASSIFGLQSPCRPRLPYRARTHGEANGGLSREWFSLKESHWLHAPSTRHADHDPSDHVARDVFTWIGHLSKEYFDVLVTQYPERSNDIKLTIKQQVACLVWDIYAHWLVFTFLLEHELWWWADLGRSDIQKLRDTLPKSNEHGYSVEVGTHDWWPSQMWSIAQDLRIRKDEVS